MKLYAQVKASEILGIPLIVTEQNPKGMNHNFYLHLFPRFFLLYISIPKAFGSTASELEISHARLKVAKTKFSMYVPEVAEEMAKSGIKSVVLFGLEVWSIAILSSILAILPTILDKGQPIFRPDPHLCPPDDP